MPQSVQLWTDVHFPKSLGEFTGNQEAVKQVSSWAESWNKGKKGLPLLLHGQTGSGKTALAYLIAQTNNWDLFELNASDFRTKDIIEKLAGGAALNASFSGKLRLVLLDEIDGLQAADRGGAGAVVSVIKESQNPVILTANDIYSDKKLAPIRAACNCIEFRKINYLSLASYLKDVCRKNNVEFDDEAIKELAKNSSGDMRSALLDLQTLAMPENKITLNNVNSLGYRERQDKIFSTLRQIFHSQSIDEVRKARFASDLSTDLLERWIEENIPRAYTDAGDNARAFEWLSRADIFNGRIMRRQHYGFLRYSSELMSSGVAVAKEKPYDDFVMYKFPQLLSKLSRSQSTRAMKKSLAGKMKEHLHGSMHAILTDDLPYLKMLFENKELALQLTALFGFDEKELAFLLSTKPGTKKVKNLLENAAKLQIDEIKTKRGLPLSPPEAQELEPEEAELPKPELNEEEAQKQTTLF